MNNLIVIRTSAVAAVLGAVMSAHAVGISLISGGTVLTSGLTATGTETVLQQRGGFGPLANLHYTFGVDLTGTGIYTGSGGELDFSFALGTFVNNNGSESSDGTWTATGGTGTYAGATGSGSLALNILNTATDQESGTVFSGAVTAAPEPAPIAALAIGAICLLRRRKI